jgi:hypothetical protein
VVVEPALTDGNRSADEALFDQRNVTRRVELSGIVGMDSGRRENEAGIGLSDRRRGGCRCRRFADADDRLRARSSGAGDYLVAVAVEGRVREVGVAVDEDRLPSILRGHFRSIHRRIGAAT